MTKIVYDDGAIYTDSRHIIETNGDMVAVENTSKLYFNESKTVVAGVCGQAVEHLGQHILFRLIEAHLVTDYIMANRFFEGHEEMNKLALMAFANMQVLVKRFGPETPLVDLYVEMSMQQQCYFDKQSVAIPYGGMKAIGLFSNAYYVWKKLGYTPVQIYKRISEMNNLTGGTLNIVQQESLQKPNYIRYFADVGIFNPKKLPMLLAETKDTQAQHKKALAILKKAKY